MLISEAVGEFEGAYSYLQFALAIQAEKGEEFKLK
jgi:hypothetical protein